MCQSLLGHPVFKLNFYHIFISCVSNAYEYICLKKSLCMYIIYWYFFCPTRFINHVLKHMHKQFFNFLKYICLPKFSFKFLDFEKNCWFFLFSAYCIKVRIWLKNTNTSTSREPVIFELRFLLRIQKNPQTETTFTYIHIYRVFH